MKKDAARYAVRFRVYAHDLVAMGPGKADLLEGIAETGSISKAAREMEMSYKRAWSLVQTMNEAFDGPVVSCEAGGSGGGGAALTDLGRDVLRSYRSAERAALKGAEPHLEKLAARLKK